MKKERKDKSFTCLKLRLADSGEESRAKVKTIKSRGPSSHDG